jgi:hypothetical protein
VGGEEGGAEVREQIAAVSLEHQINFRETEALARNFINCTVY